VASHQGDQIGRIFAFWVIVNLVSYLLITDVRRNFWATFISIKNTNLSITAKMGWATFWAIFFTNSSGHPATHIHFCSHLHAHSHHEADEVGRSQPTADNKINSEIHFIFLDDAVFMYLIKNLMF
jgi:hypothetical protein